MRAAHTVTHHICTCMHADPLCQRALCSAGLAGGVKCGCNSSQGRRLLQNCDASCCPVWHRPRGVPGVGGCGDAGGQRGPALARPACPEAAAADGAPPARAQADALARAADLEAENAELRLVAGRRRAALTQSRRYLGAYLARSAAMLAEQQAALQGARPAPEARAGPAPAADGAPAQASSNGAPPRESASGPDGADRRSEGGGPEPIGDGALEANGTVPQPEELPQGPQAAPSADGPPQASERHS